MLGRFGTRVGRAVGPIQDRYIYKMGSYSVRLGMGWLPSHRTSITNLGDWVHRKCTTRGGGSRGLSNSPFDSESNQKLELRNAGYLSDQ